MSPDFCLPKITNAEIEQKANEFLSKFHPERSIPIPIEDIIDFKMKIHICPLVGLVDVFNVEAYLSKDMTEISVDQDRIMNVPNRYRYSLAHEVGHIFLHSDIYSGISIANTDEFKEFQSSVDLMEYDEMERQAYLFAELVLVPTDILVEKFNSECKHMVELIGYESADKLKSSPNFPEYISSSLGKMFNVSKQVIIQRLRRTKMIDPNYRY